MGFRGSCEKCSNNKELLNERSHAVRGRAIECFYVLRNIVCIEKDIFWKGLSSVNAEGYEFDSHSGKWNI